MFFAFSSCDSGKQKFIEENINFATGQTNILLDNVGEATGKNYPRTTRSDGRLSVTSMYDWTPGFFPGSLWYLYELTNDEYWKNEAAKWTESLEPLKTFTGHHDLGFMMYCSYGNAERLAPKAGYKDILIESANSLATRFSDTTKTIKSWNYRKAWNGVDEWFYPVIIDNLMNLELLFYGAKASGDERLYNIAVTHAESTLKNHFRNDYSTYHVVNYDIETGDVLHQQTCQGFSDNSTWSRGQAWAIYGFTMVYRETGDEKYLDAAVKATDFYLSKLSDNDLIPLWDFNVAEEGYAPEGKSYAVQFQEKLKDASAGAIVCSALFELGEYTKNKEYTDIAIKMLQELASPKYRAVMGQNAGFLLEHSVGSIPHHVEIDVPLVYADYYFLEAMVRYKNLQ
ncbi:glycosyl hydrolase family 88 [Paludibacter sp. 221]|nr:glycosyl hydrolase family 88 [Paludibacter sp. 221]